MENYIVINGRKAELTEEQLKALGLVTETESPFDRVEKGKTYYAIAGTGNIGEWNDHRNQTDDSCYDVANYCTDREILQQQAYREKLNRLLWRYSMEHDGNNLDWKSKVKRKCTIQYNHDRNEFRGSRVYTVEYVGSVTFATMEIAENAIKEIVEPFMAEHPDFKF